MFDWEIFALYHLSQGAVIARRKNQTAWCIFYPGDPSENILLPYEVARKLRTSGKLEVINLNGVADFENAIALPKGGAEKLDEAIRMKPAPHAITVGELVQQLNTLPASTEIWVGNSFEVEPLQYWGELDLRVSQWSSFGPPQLVWPVLLNQLGKRLIGERNTTSWPAFDVEINEPKDQD